jgi:hypothetical protein
MERRKFLPAGTLLYLPALPLETTSDDIVETFDRAGIFLPHDCVDLREHPDRMSAVISVSNNEVARILQRTFSKNGVFFKDPRNPRRGWKVKVAPFGTKTQNTAHRPAFAQIPSTENAWPPHNVERRG